jgi:hypothetical protein
MVLKYNCQIKIPVIATRWEKHGDHPNVLETPPEVNIEGAEKHRVGMLPTPQGHTAFVGPVWIIDSGGHTFPVDDNYFNEYYLTTSLIDEPVNEPVVEEITDDNNNVS